MGREIRLDYNTIPWDEYFEYSENSDTGLIWKHGSNLGEPVGHCLYYKSGKPRAYQVCVKGKTYLAHRVIWCIVYGCIDNTLSIDHIDGNAFNNNISNLRLVTKEINMRNTSLRKDSSTGVNGVQRTNRITGKDYYIAVWRDNGIRKSKCFNIEKLGEEVAFLKSKLFREEKILQLNENGAGYTERHGT